MKKTILMLAIATAVILYFGTAQERKTFGGSSNTSTEQNQTDKKTFDNQSKQTTNKTQSAQTSKNKSKAKLYKGTVASLTGVYMGNYTITKDEAIRLAENGSPIVFVQGKGKKAKIAFLIDHDGSFLGKKLANYANNKTVAVNGWEKVINGVRYIIVDFIESAD